MWPISIAPWHIYLCPLRYDDEKVSAMTNELYDKLSKIYDVILDDRTNVNAGAKFTDSELLGIPVRVVVSPKTLEKNSIEVSLRETGETTLVQIDEIFNYLSTLVKNKMLNN